MHIVSAANKQPYTYITLPLINTAVSIYNQLNLTMIK